jgi:hypothetical protein
MRQFIYNGLTVAITAASFPIGFVAISAFVIRDMLATPEKKFFR